MTSTGAAPKLHVFILTKNEEANIDRCLSALDALNVRVTVMDSSSTDRTHAIVEKHKCATLIERKYQNHCETYNYICSQHECDAEYVMVLDADMIVDRPLYDEIAGALEVRSREVVRCPVRMRVEGKDLQWGSLYPPKPIVFKRGRSYFHPMGHGERLVDEVAVAQTKNSLIHDDRKDFNVYLASQARYAQALVDRARSGSINFKDRMRLSTPIMLLLAPAVTYLLKLGFLSGRAGIVYALDRLIAEAVAFRQAQASKLSSDG